MAGLWAEQWSFGTGPSKVSCGISRTEDGFSVDLFRGETCVDSFCYRTREDAERLTRKLRLEYLARYSSATG